MPPSQRLLFVEITRETALQPGVELVRVERIEQVELQGRAACAGEHAGVLGRGDFVTLDHAEIAAAGIEIEADVAAREPGAENPLRLLFHLAARMQAQFPGQPAAAIVYGVVGLAGGAQFRDQALRDARGLPGVRNRVRQAAGER